MKLVEVGYFYKTHGVKGQLILKSDSEFFYEELNALFIEQGGSKAPYFISSVSEAKNGLIFLLEEVKSVEEAKLLIGKKVFIEEKFVVTENDEENYLGFELIDKNYGSLGEILDVNDNGIQLIVSLRFKEKELILPLVEEMIEKIDIELKKIYYNAPDGLIDLYLN